MDDGKNEEDEKAKGSERGGGAARLRERNVLVRPGEEDIVVDRYFTKVSPPPDTNDTRTTSAN